MTKINTDLQKLTIAPATQEQRLEVIKYAHENWGHPGTGVDFYTQFHSIIEATDYAKEGRLIYWVLVPEDDKATPDILSCCRTYRRDASILHANSDKPTHAFGYAIGTVVTPKAYRGQGYAQRMLALLHHALAPNVYPSPGVNIDIPPSVYPGAFSVLYSDIRNYYERCGPVPGEIGWKVQSPFSTVWQLSETLSVLSSRTGPSYEVELLSKEQVTALLSSDVINWEEVPREPDTTYVAFSPSAPPNTHLITRSSAHPLYNKSGTIWGARIASNGHFISWAYDYRAPSTVMISRINADSSTLPALLLAALRAGETQGCEQAEVWNLAEGLSKEAQHLGGTFHERTLHLSAIRWYGPEPAKNVVWARNE